MGRFFIPAPFLRKGSSRVNGRGKGQAQHRYGPATLFRSFPGTTRPEPLALHLRLALAALLLVAAAQTAEAAPGTRVQHLRGSCESLQLANRPATRGCRPSLVNLTYPGGTMSFVFTDRTGRLISFFGRVAHRSGSQATVKVGQITLVPRGTAQATRLPAIGSCVLTPFAADRARLECSAKARGGAYSALFKTSGTGRPPVTL